MREFTYYDLWASQWKDVMRNSDILRPCLEKSGSWDPAIVTKIGRIMLEDVDLNSNRGCVIRINWSKHSKNGTAGDLHFKNTFLVDVDSSAIYPGVEITCMLNMR